LLNKIEKISSGATKCGLDFKKLLDGQDDIKEISEFLGITHDQTILFACLVELSLQKTVTLEHLARHFKCSVIKIIILFNEIEELVRKKFIKKCYNERLKQGKLFGKGCNKLLIVDKIFGNLINNRKFAFNNTCHASHKNSAPGQVFAFYGLTTSLNLFQMPMQFNKPAISLADQVARLKSRGLKIADETEAELCLANISYYRLRAYTYPFQDNTDTNHAFVISISFDDIIELYKFDRRLSQLIFAALEKIEIALRTQIIHHWAMAYGSHWQLEPALYRDPMKFANQINSLQTEINRSHETFIEHYKNTYTTPSEPPAWMSLEVSSFGLLSQIFSNLKKGNEKLAIANHFGLNDLSILENWMLCFSNIRNICAHHGRLWNRRLTAHIKFPNNPQNTFIAIRQIYPYKLYAALCCVQYMLNTIIPANGFKTELIDLMKTCPLAQEKEMGFPANWLDENFWK